MKANSKKLLSLLMAVAMVLSMVPAISLQAEAAFDATNTVCDACGKAPEGGWKEITSTSQISAAGHYYFSSDFEVTAKSGLNFAISSGAACLNLNGVTVDNPTSGSGYRTLSCTAGTLNIMGSGTVKSLNTSKTGAGGAIYASGGTINLYGGTYTTGNKDTSVFSVLNDGTLNVYNATVTLGTMGASSGANSTVNIYGGTLPCAIRCGSASYGVFNIYGGDFSGSTRGIIYSVGPRSLTITGGTFSADPSSYVPGVSCYSVANNTVSASHTKAAGDEGTVVVAGNCTTDGKVEYTCSVEGCGAKFTEVTKATGHDFGSNNATCATCGAANPNYVSLPSVCPGCKETVTEWIAVNGASGDNNWTADMSGHYYLAKDITGGGKRVFSFPADTEVCLHLNNKSITSTCTQSSAITVRSYGTLRIVGEGTISAGENTAAMGAVVPCGGTVEIYGGTYLDNTDNAPVRENGGNAVVYGGNFCDSVSGFVAEGYEQTENADGTFTVTKLDLPTTCPCGAENIEWTELTSAGFGTSHTEHKHWYVNGALTVTGTGNSMQTYADQCVYLMSGATLTNNGTVRARGGFDVHFFGEGSYVRANSEGTGVMFNSASSGNIYFHSGTYTNNADVTMFDGTRYIITGGTFNADPSEFVADGYKATKNGDVWTVGLAPEVDICPLCGVEVDEWTEAAAADTFTAGGEHIKVSADLVRSGAGAFVVVPEGKTTCLWLEGELSNSGKGVAVAVLGGTLNIGGTADGAITRVATSSGTLQDVGLVYVKSGTLNVSDITISGGQTSGDADTVAETTAGVRYQNATGNGGNVYVEAGTFNLKSGAVAGGIATGKGNTNSVYTNGGCGGNIFVAPGATFTMDAGSVTGGTSTGSGNANMGGNIFAGAGATVTVNGGSIADGEADLNKTKSRGGNIYSMGATLNLLGGSITGGKSGNIGGNIECSGESKVTLGGNASVSGGQATSSNEIYMANTSKLTVDAGWTGTATIVFASVEVARGQALPAENGVSTGAYTGKLYWNHTVPTQIFGIDGGLTLGAAGVITENSNTWYMSAQDAVDAYNGTGYVLVGTNASIVLNKDTAVDNGGNAVVVSGSGKLSAMDSAGDGTWDLSNANIVRDVTNPVTGERFLTVGTETYEFKMKVTKVVLRPGTTAETLGMYYKTEITIGEQLVGLIDSYGVALSLVDMPTADDILAVDGDALYTVVNNDLVAGVNTVNSGLLKNILKTDYTADELTALGVSTIAEANTLRGSLPVFANAYIALDLDGDGEEEFIMADVDYNNIQHSMKSLMTKADGVNLDANPALVECYKTWAPLGMNQWGLTNLANKIAEA